MLKSFESKPHEDRISPEIRIKASSDRRSRIVHVRAFCAYATYGKTQGKISAIDGSCGDKETVKASEIKSYETL